MTPVHRLLRPNEHDSAAVGRCALAIMTKAPRAGQVKTRLTPPLTPEEAAGLNRCFLQDLAASITAAGGSGQGIGCYTPVGAEEAYGDLFPPGFQLIPQRNGDFGSRLAGAVKDLLSVGFASVCLINSDSPTTPAAAFAEAVEVLARPEDLVVLGPSDDGGYYLIGLKQVHRRLFEGIDWSTERVMSQTLERAAELGLGVHLLPACYDVDDRVTLGRLCQDLLGPNDSEAAPATRSFLQTLVRQEGPDRIWPQPLAAR